MVNTVISLVTIALILVSVFVVITRTGVIETEYINVNAKATESIELEKANSERMNRTINRANENFAYYDNAIKEIEDRMQKIIADIERIDADEKEIRRYYINFREKTEVAEDEPVSVE